MCCNLIFGGSLSGDWRLLIASSFYANFVPQGALSCCFISITLFSVAYCLWMEVPLPTTCDRPGFHEFVQFAFQVLWASAITTNSGSEFHTVASCFMKNTCFAISCWCFCQSNLLNDSWMEEKNALWALLFTPDIIHIAMHSYCLFCGQIILLGLFWGVNIQFSCTQRADMLVLFPMKCR